jgi:serine O-acetyltransferase
MWQTIRAEAQADSVAEPLLSSFLYATILSHSSFEGALSSVLANRLACAQLLSTQLLELFNEVLSSDEGVRLAARCDVAATRQRDPACRTHADCLLYFKGYHAVQAYRIAHALWGRGQTLLAVALQSRCSEVFAVDIHPAARIGRGILLDHGTGVVIGETAVVGDRVSILQGVTLGGTGKDTGDRHPKIGQGVLIGAHACVLGNIAVGEGAMIAAGSLVLKSVAPHTMVAGSPAKEVGAVIEPFPSLSMRQEGDCLEWEKARMAEEERVEADLT